jgi:hypothetical protein
VSAEGPVEVLAGQAGDLHFVVRAEKDGADLYTMLRVSRGSQVLVAGSGMGGPPLWPGSVLNEWRGRTEGLPYFVMARTVPEVDRVVATTDLGLEVELALSPPVAEFGLRFAAAALPAGHGPGNIRAERGGEVIGRHPQPVPPPGSRPR